VLSALKLSVLGAVLALAGSAAIAGGAPAAYYPSLGYGQTPPYEVAPGGYVDAPAYAGEPEGPPPGYEGPPPGYQGPPPGYAGPPTGYGGPARPCNCSAPPPPPRPDCHCVASRPLPPPPPRDWRGEGPPPVVYGQGEEERFAERGYGEQAYGEVRREEYDYDSGWRIRPLGPAPAPCPYADMAPPHPVCGGVVQERYEQSEQLPDVFFADAGGVGPDEFEGGGGGGGGVIEGGGGEASAGAFAFASASARASASIGIRIGRHPGGGGHHGGGHMPHGCGCKR